MHVSYKYVNLQHLTTNQAEQLTRTFAVLVYEGFPYSQMSLIFFDVYYLDSIAQNFPFGPKDRNIKKTKHTLSITQKIHIIQPKTATKASFTLNPK